VLETEGQSMTHAMTHDLPKKSERKFTSGRPAFTNKNGLRKINMEEKPKCG
jgi:hypothetical protein